MKHILNMTVLTILLLCTQVRNLCYMVQRREKLSKQMGVMRQAIFYKQCELFNGDTSQYSQTDLSWALRAIELSNGVPRDAVDNSSALESLESGKKMATSGIKAEPKDDESDRSSTSSGSRDSSPDSSSRSGSSAHSGSERNSRESSPRSRSSKGGGNGKGRDNNSGGESGKGGDNVESCPNEDGVDTAPPSNRAENNFAQNNNNDNDNIFSRLRHGSRNVKRKLSMDSEETLPPAKRHQKNGTFKSDYARKFEEYLQSVNSIEPRRTTRQSASTLDTEIDTISNTRQTRQGSTLREMQLIEEAGKVHAQLKRNRLNRKDKKGLSPVKSDSDSEVICVSPPRPQSLGLTSLNISTPTQEDQRSCQSTPETRSARKRIEEELDRQSECSDRQFENIDEEISMCFLDSNENTKDGRESPLASPLVTRLTRQSKQQGLNLNRRSRLSLRRSENCELQTSQLSSVGNETEGSGVGEVKKPGVRNRLVDVAYRVFNSALGL